MIFVCIFNIKYYPRIIFHLEIGHFRDHFNNTFFFFTFTSQKLKYFYLSENSPQQFDKNHNFMMWYTQQQVFIHKYIFSLFFRKLLLYRRQ